MTRNLPLTSLALTGLLVLFPALEKVLAQNNSVQKHGDAWYADPMDWPNWRGPELNGVSREKGLVDRWNPRGENVLWKSEKLGGRSTPICMRGKLYTIVRDHPGTAIEGEKVVCVDAATGAPLWENVFNVYLSDVPDTRVGWSSVVGDPETGNVFAMGVCGYLQCIAGETIRKGKQVEYKPGDTIWSRSLIEEHGIISAFGGRAAFPVVSGNLVIVSSVFVDWGDKSQPAQRVIAFDKRNGRMVWYEDTRLRPEDVSFSTPIPTVLNGAPLLTVASGDGSVYGFQTRTGKHLWSYNASPRGIQATPLVVKNRVYVGQAEENRGERTMGAFFAVDASKRGDLTKSGELWRDKEMRIAKVAAVPADGKLVVVDETGYLYVVDPDNGKLFAKKKIDTACTGSPIFADGKIYVCTLSGIWWTLKPTENGVQEVFKFRTSGGGETNASPIVSHGRIYLQQADMFYCIGKQGQTPQADPRPEMPKETPADADPTPALLQIVPAESLLKPSYRQPFEARLYNSRGQFLRIAKPDEVKFSVDGPGTVGEEGFYVKYTAPSGHAPAVATVRAQMGELKGSARVRVVPDLDWKFDFNDGQVPITWVGARYRNIPIDYDLLAKLKSQNPPASYLYIYLMSLFVNSGRSSLKFDNNTPQQTWTELLRYLDLIEKAGTPESAKAQLDPLLKALAAEKFVAKWAWPNKKGIELIVQRGPRKIEGNGVMLKITTIPRGARSQCFFGPVDLHDYTIQADVSGAIRNGRMPDVGVIAQRYVLQLRGDQQKLDIHTWPAHDVRAQKNIPFSWKPDTWYTLKFQASNENGKVVLRGKAWPRGDKEPAAWSIELTDPSPHPNIEGSPGLTGDAKISEIFYDNVLVTRNATAMR